MLSKASCARVASRTCSSGADIQLWGTELVSIQVHVALICPAAKLDFQQYFIVCRTQVHPLTRKRIKEEQNSGQERNYSHTGWLGQQKGISLMEMHTECMDNTKQAYMDKCLCLSSVIHASSVHSHTLWLLYKQYVQGIVCSFQIRISAAQRSTFSIPSLLLFCPRVLLNNAQLHEANEQSRKI